jgi:hypothetical protein
MWKGKYIFVFSIFHDKKDNIIEEGEVVMVSEYVFNEIIFQFLTFHLETESLRKVTDSYALFIMVFLTVRLQWLW